MQPQTKRPFKLLIAAIFLIALPAAAYLGYPQVQRYFAQPKSAEIENTPKQNRPVDTATKTTAAQEQKSLLSKYGQLEFPAVAASAPVSQNEIPGEILNLLVNAQGVNAEKLVFAGQLPGLRANFQYASGDLKSVFEKNIQIMEAGGLEINTAARSEQFAFGDFQNAKFKARLSLTLETNIISGKITTIYK